MEEESLLSSLGIQNESIIDIIINHHPGDGNIEYQDFELIRDTNYEYYQPGYEECNIQNSNNKNISG